MRPEVPTKDQQHASAVAIGTRAILITGTSGAGKSALALDLIARGARLVADDQVRLTRHEDQIFLDAPNTAAPLIEARGIGILDLTDHEHHPKGPQAPPILVAVVDLEDTPGGRLPRPAHRDLLGLPVPLISGGGVPNLAPVIDAILRGAVLLDPDERL